VDRRVVRVAAAVRVGTVALTATMVFGFVAPSAAVAAPVDTRFAAADTATITPGVQMLTPLSRREAASCTAAFVFTAQGLDYLGYAAHCAAEDADPSRSGCEEEPLPLGSPVTIVGRDGTRSSGRLAYSSWRTMEERGETDQDLCALNDFALVALEPADLGRVNPSVPELGGPVGLDTDGTSEGERVFSYQPNNPGEALKEGVSLGDSGEGRTHRVETAPAGNPGDSGSGYLDGNGTAFGVLSTQFSDPRSTNGVADLAMAMSYASSYGDLGTIGLVRGTEPFHAPADTR
jgi:hypothetical protein